MWCFDGHYFAAELCATFLRFIFGVSRFGNTGVLFGFAGAVVGEGALVEAVEEFGYVCVDLDAAGFEELLAGPAAGGDADGADPGLAGGLRVVGGITQGEDAGGLA